jgi:hypothetical protein
MAARTPQASAIVLVAWLAGSLLLRPALADGLRFAFEPASRFGVEEPFHVLSMRGEIDVGDGQRFRQFVLEHRERFIDQGGRVALVIDGGDVEEALHLGELLRDALVEAWLPDASRTRCVSACFFVFAHCVSRRAVPESVGLHRPYFEARALASASPDAVRRRYQRLQEELRARLTQLGVPVALIEIQQALPAGEVYRLTEADLSRLGVRQPWFDDYLAARCEGREAGAKTMPSSCQEDLLRDHRRRFVEQNGAAPD